MRTALFRQIDFLQRCATGTRHALNHVAHTDSLDASTDQSVSRPDCVQICELIARLDVDADVGATNRWRLSSGGRPAATCGR